MIDLDEVQVAVGCADCGQRGKLALAKLSSSLRCRCGSDQVEALDERKDVRHVRHISIKRQADYLTVDQSADDICPRCGGSGNDPDPDAEKCVRCGGSGKVASRRAMPQRQDVHVRHTEIIEDILASNPGTSLGKAASLARRAGSLMYPKQR